MTQNSGSIAVSHNCVAIANHGFYKTQRQLFVGKSNVCDFKRGSSSVKFLMTSSVNHNRQNCSIFQYNGQHRVTANTST